MNFLTAGEKIKRIRKQLKLTQEDLQMENVTRGLISMIETDKRYISYNTAVKLTEKFNERAEELNIILNVDEAYLMRSPKEDAELYCLRKLKDSEIKKDEIDSIFQIIKEYNLIEVKAEAYCSLGEIYFKEKDFGKACDIYKKAREIYIDVKKNSKLGYIYWKMGVCKADGLKYDTAIEYYQLSQYYCDLCKDFKTKKLCLYSLANGYKYLNQIDLALEIIEKFLSVCDEQEDYRLYIFAQGIKASCYEVRMEYDKEIQIYKEILLKITDRKNIFIGYAYNNLGRAYAAKNDFKESMKYFDIARKVLNELDKSLLSHTIIEKSEALLKQNLFNEAIDTAKLGLKYAEEFKDVEYLLKGNYLISDIYYKLNDYKNLESTYLKIVNLLDTSGDKNNLKSVYTKLALMYLKHGYPKVCEKYLLLSINLN